MNERDYLRLKRRFEKEYKEKLRALELIWQEASGGKKAPKEPKEGSESNGVMVSRGNAAAAVAEFVQQFNGDVFSAKQVDAWIFEAKGARANRTTIIHKLRRMVNDGELVLASQGSGKRGSVYRLQDSTPPVDPPPELPEEPEQPRIAMATEQEIDQLREVIRAQEINVSQFRAGVLQAEFGVQKAAELTHDQINQLIQRYNPGSPPSDDIPF